MKKIILLGVILSFFVAVPIYAQNDGVVYTCDGGENDITVAANAAYATEDWELAVVLAEEGEALCASDVFRYREMAKLHNDAQTQLDLIETQAFIDESYPGMVDLGDYSVFMRCVGEGSPTIIFEHGLGTSVSQTWLDISPEFEAVTQVCTYDRVGVGLSDGLSANTLRTTQNMVDDLGAILEIEDISGPYILVGHSIAGFNILLFADQYPDAVVGMVMIDSSHPDQVRRGAEINPDLGSAEGQPVSTERMDLWASVAEVQAVGDLGDIPLFVLTAGDNVDEDSAQNPEFAMMWRELQEDHAARSTNSQHIIVEGAPHFIMQTDPDVIIEAIYWVWEQITVETDAVEE